MSKFTDPIHEPPPDPALVARRVAARRRHDRVDNLEQGFTFRASGRDGYIYYRESDKLIEFYWEMSGVDDYDILLSLDGLTQWALPRAEPVTSERQAELLDALRSWLAANKIRALITEARR